MKRFMIILLTLSLLLCGCGGDVDADAASDTEAVTQINEENANLWIVVDGAGTEWVSGIVDAFLQKHEGVTVKLDVMPGPREERNVWLEQLRVQIMAGKGPDLYLLYLPRYSDSLFLDISMAMRNGMFLDISQYYDADTALDKERLQSEIMDAGVVNGERYVLPLRFQFPIAYVNTELLESTGVDIEDCGRGLAGAAEAAKTLKSQTLVTQIGFFKEYFLSLFGEAIDYEKQKVTLKQKELEKILKQYRSLTADMGTDILCTAVSFNNYTSENEFWAKPGLKTVYDWDINFQFVQEPYAIEVSNLTDLVGNLRIAKAENIELAVVPMTASDGSLTATVTFCGAIGANCQYPQLAYEILREFLLEENQWYYDMAIAVEGWPVLVEGSWDKRNKEMLNVEFSAGVYRDEEKNTRRNVLKFAELTEEDFSVLDTRIDAVRFPYSRETDLMERIDSQLNLARNPDAMSVDVAELAEEIIWELELHLAEG